jgi:quercetin dioxygenase-like cupin family protein
MSGDALHFHLPDERAHVNDPALLARNGRNARTILKEGPLRVTMVMLAPGGQLASHHADGPLTAQVLDGDIRFHVAGKDHDLASGDLLLVNGGLEHVVSSSTGGTFLLTVVHEGT